MTRRFVDLSVSLDADIAFDPPGLHPRINYLDHHDTAKAMLDFFPA